VRNRWKDGTGNLSEPNGTVKGGADLAQTNLSSIVKGKYGGFRIEQRFS